MVVNILIMANPNQSNNVNNLYQAMYTYEVRLDYHRHKQIAR